MPEDVQGLGKFQLNTPASSCFELCRFPKTDVFVIYVNLSDSLPQVLELGNFLHRQHPLTSPAILMLIM